MIVTSLVLARLDVVDCRNVLYHVCNREPTLTTIRRPRGDLGAAGVQALLASLRGEPSAAESPIVLQVNCWCATARDLRPTVECNDRELQSAGLQVRQRGAKIERAAN